ncbi:hypothetical protein [Variovorax sp. dw_954]|uniref:hypothetical protein n=1 Tax=Variovorax sp. dw_954 TaxID=2720078 RepID=UPI001BD41723|nr:hypothetical protein [Variovorax sp. dw_954]
MNLLKPGWFAAACGAALLMTACGGGGGNSGLFLPTTTTPTAAKPTVSVDDLSTGSYVVSTDDANAPTIGKYYAAADGSRLLVFSDSDDRAKRVYRRDAGGAWVGVPAADKDVQVTLLQSNALPAATVDLATLAGSYAVQVATGVSASLAVAADGTITPGAASACKLSGKLSAGTLPRTLKLALSTSGCSGLPATASGVLVVDSDYAPASFRLLADDGAQVIDLWAFKE